MSENPRSRVGNEARSRDLPPSKAALTRSAILDAGTEFLETNPFRELTVGKLMATTQHSRSTFYFYFNDLHGLMETLLEEVKGGIVDGANEWLMKEGDPVSGLQRSIKAVVDVGFEHGTILKAVADAASSDARLEHVWQTFLASFDELVADRIAFDQAKGITPEFDPLPVARALNRMDAGTLIHAFGTGAKANKGNVLSAMTRVWVSTLYPFDAKTAIGRTTP